MMLRTSWPRLAARESARSGQIEEGQTDMAAERKVEDASSSTPG